MSPKTYHDDFYDYHLEGALNSAEVIIPIVKKYINPASVIDVGCGIGAWLSIWKKNGVTHVLGIDGDYVDTTKLLIDKSEFKAYNLENRFSTDKKYDIVTCLEVAEHLPEKYAESFVDSLCKLGDAILFSAAIPGQRGTSHVNEQFPGYWAKQFITKGFIPIDCIRLTVWDNPAVKWWYKQNILFFVKEDKLANYPLLEAASKEVGRDVKALVHQELIEHINSRVDNYEKLLGYYERLLKSPYMTFKHAAKTMFARKNNK